jgi:hypothetical protein
VSLAPTPKLRWVRRIDETDARTMIEEGVRPRMVLQQWWAAYVPSYMRGMEGEWRDVITEDVPSV